MKDKLQKVCRVIGHADELVIITKNLYGGYSTAVKNERGEWFDMDPDTLREAALLLSRYGFGEEESLLFPEEAARAARGIAVSEAVGVDGRSRDFAERLRTASFPDRPVLQNGMAALLRPYQVIGAEFLMERCRYGVGAILADDMGLGKTVQMLAVLDAFHARHVSEGRPFRALVVAPASVVDVWLRQAEAFCPGLQAAALGGGRERQLDGAILHPDR